MRDALSKAWKGLQEFAGEVSKEARPSLVDVTATTIETGAKRLWRAGTAAAEKRREKAAEPPKE